MHAHEDDRALGAMEVDGRGWYPQGGPLHRTISAPPLASALPQRALKESLFDFTSIFDGDVLQDSPPPAHKRQAVCNIHATSASDVSPQHPLVAANTKTFDSLCMQLVCRRTLSLSWT